MLFDIRVYTYLEIKQTINRFLNPVDLKQGQIVHKRCKSTEIQHFRVRRQKVCCDTDKVTDTISCTFWSQTFFIFSVQICILRPKSLSCQTYGHNV